MKPNLIRKSCVHLRMDFLPGDNLLRLLFSLFTMRSMVPLWDSLLQVVPPFWLFTVGTFVIHEVVWAALNIFCIFNNSRYL